MSRIEKVNQLIKREISNLLLFGEISDPRVKMVTIQSVDTSKDLQHARVRFSVLTDNPDDVKEAIKGLDASRGYIRRLIAGRVDLRYIPEIQFIFDKGVQYMAQVDQKLEEIRKLKKAEGDQNE